MKTIKIEQEFVVPVQFITSVFEYILDNDLGYHVTEADNEEDTLTIAVTCDKEDKNHLREIEDLIEDDDNDENDDDDGDDDEDDE